MSLPKSSARETRDKDKIRRTAQTKDVAVGCSMKIPTKNAAVQTFDVAAQTVDAAMQMHYL